MPTEIDREAMKGLYFGALRKFMPETIKRAVEETIIHSKYPDLSHLVGLCEEFSKTNRYGNVRISRDEKEFVRKPMPDSLREMIRRMK